MNMEMMLENYSNIRVEEEEKKKYIEQWRKNVTKRMVKSLPAFLLLILACIGVMKSITRGRDSVLINLIIGAIFSGWVIYLFVVFLLEIKGYRKSKSLTWHKTLVYITNTGRGKIYGTYYKDGVMYTGEIKRSYGNDIGEFKMRLATLIMFDGCCKTMLLSTVDWNEEIRNVNEPLLKEFL